MHTEPTPINGPEEWPDHERLLAECRGALDQLAGALATGRHAQIPAAELVANLRLIVAGIPGVTWYQVVDGAQFTLWEILDQDSGALERPQGA